MNLESDLEIRKHPASSLKSPVRRGSNKEEIMEGQLEKGGVFSNPTLGARVSGAKLCTCQRDLSLKVDCYLQWLPANCNHNNKRKINTTKSS